MKMVEFISSIKNPKQATALEGRMSEYYRNFTAYYDHIDFSSNSWIDISNLVYVDILSRIPNKQIVEIGCGRANALETDIIDQNMYSGCDFSPELILENQKRFPNSTFKVVEDSNRFPFEDNSADVVFSCWVLEHVAKPHLFLEELKRIVRPGGQILIVCPDFFGRLGISSQLSGKFQGTGSAKLRKGLFFDSLTTLWIGKIAVPMILLWKLRNAHNEPVFLLNNKPACFIYPEFAADIDAIYVTYRKEIVKYMKGLGGEIVENSESLNTFCSINKCIYLVFNF